jgi:hypothetical protein
MEEGAHIVEMSDTLVIHVSSYMGIQNGGMSCRPRRKKTTQHLRKALVKLL